MGISVENMAGMDTTIVTMEHKGIPCMTEELLASIYNLNVNTGYLVFKSSREDVFNLGGDLGLFIECIEKQDRERLFHYGEYCIQTIDYISRGFDRGVYTFAAVEGQALGGGLEGPIACNEIIASYDAVVGFPEHRFGLFPGMGAITLLKGKISDDSIVNLISSENVSTADEWPKSIVNKLCDPGDAVRMTLDTIQARRRKDTRALAKRAMAASKALNYHALVAVLDVWTDAAMDISPENLKKMKAIHRAQRIAFE